MPPTIPLAVCPRCACHAKLNEGVCPCCGNNFDATTWLKPAAAILAMGLAACSSTVDSSSGASASASTGNNTSGQGVGGSTSQGVTTVAAGYTVAVSVGAGGAPGTTGGTGGSGGVGGNAGTGGSGGSGGANAGTGGSGGAGGQ